MKSGAHRDRNTVLIAAGIALADHCLWLTALRHQPERQVHVDQYLIESNAFDLLPFSGARDNQPCASDSREGSNPSRVSGFCDIHLPKHGLTTSCRQGEPSRGDVTIAAFFRPVIGDGPVSTAALPNFFRRSSIARFGMRRAAVRECRYRRPAEPGRSALTPVAHQAGKAGAVDLPCQAIFARTPQRSSQASWCRRVDRVANGCAGRKIGGLQFLA